ncbi:MULTISPECIES: FkbM family methyltransferase [unclassified Xanthomonas]|uniref:FkbM family methyltransferase n=1 Tax=Xanthomonas sp. LMG 9002 TaxID=1591158 RepID=UPI00136A5D52|nr:FkbM family methyltransferase [Xanthomonas sp. LMG 9002]MXV07417.1 FkbM family methyltransferase [Xanthomonas sp. LMG 9002]
MTYTNQNETDLLEACMKADTIVFLAPSSYLGDFVTPLVDNLRQRSEKLRLIAADDYFHTNRGKAPGFDEIRTVAAHLANPQGPNSITVNCSFQLSTWLYFDHLQRGLPGRAIDLPELLYILDRPWIYHTGPVMRAQTLERAADFAALRTRLEDTLSRATLDAILRLRMTGNRAELLDVIRPMEQEYFSMYSSSEAPVALHDHEHYVDIGAYDGDTVGKFMTAARYRFASIHAYEPDPRNFAALQRRLESTSGPIFLHNEAVSDSNQPLSFLASGTMGSRVEAGGDIQVSSVRLDDVLEQMTLLKMDVEGFEPHVLRGAAELIGRCRPRMAITCYHHALDLLDIVAVLDVIYPGAKLRLRHYSMYFYDTILYVE